MSQYVVCEGCGFYYGTAPAPVDCMRCGSQAKWAFPNAQKAREYQAQVIDRRLRAADSQPEPMPDDARHGFACPGPEADWIAMLADDPDLHMVNANPRAWSDAHPCHCEATCHCDNSTTVEASTEPRTDHPY